MYHLQPLRVRINLILGMFVATLLLITARLFYLQINLSHHYEFRGRQNFLRVETTESPRGNIFDCKGNLLATNRPVTHIQWVGTGNRTLSGLQCAKLQSIAHITGKPLIADPQVLRNISNAEKYYKKVCIVSDVSLEQLGQIQELYPEDCNLSVIAHFQRYYPHGTCASHVLGYLSRSMSTSFYGQMGIERICDEILKGQDGTVSKIINSFGRSISTTELRHATVGNDIHTTLDLDIQRIAERIFPEGYQGALIIMAPTTGDIYAMVSRPAFNPSLFLQPVDTKTWNELQQKKPFLNRTLNPYPPGSIFKLITVSAALESKLLDPEKMWHCNGYVTFADRKYWCHNRWGHGKLNTIQAVAHSCNALFYEIGKRIDINLLSHYAHNFGLGISTGILLPEQRGIVPSREWKLTVKGEPWWPGETLSAAIGQSFLLASPIQIARMISGIFTGHLIRPRILQQEPIESVPVPVKHTTLDFLKNSMRFVVTCGTGREVGAHNIKVYAKTSTAQISDFSKRTLGTEFMEHAWFASYMQYKNYEPLIFVVLIENAGSSRIATRVARQFLIEYKNLYDHIEQQPDPSYQADIQALAQQTAVLRQI